MVQVQFGGICILHLGDYSTGYFTDKDTIYIYIYTIIYVYGFDRHVYNAYNILSKVRSVKSTPHYRKIIPLSVLLMYVNTLLQTNFDSNLMPIIHSWLIGIGKEAFSIIIIIILLS